MNTKNTSSISGISNMSSTILKRQHMKPGIAIMYGIHIMLNKMVKHDDDIQIILDKLSEDSYEFITIYSDRDVLSNINSSTSSPSSSVVDVNEHEYEYEYEYNEIKNENSNT